MKASLTAREAILRFLEEAEVVQVEDHGEGGMTWIAVGSGEKEEQGRPNNEERTMGKPGRQEATLFRFRYACPNGCGAIVE